MSIHRRRILSVLAIISLLLCSAGQASASNAGKAAATSDGRESINLNFVRDFHPGDENPSTFTNRESVNLPHDYQISQPCVEPPVGRQRILRRPGKERKVFDADQLVTFKLQGDASIAGVAGGDISSNERMVVSQNTLWHGACQVVLRSGSKPGTVTPEASADGLKSARVELYIE